MTTLPELSRRVSEATGPDRYLDMEIATAFGAGVDLSGNPHWMGDDELPRYTASLDAVAALIAEKLPGPEWSVFVAPAIMARGGIWNEDLLPDIKSDAKTPALALLAATLLAIHERNKSDE